MDLLSLLVTGILLKHIYAILTFIFVIVFRHLPVHKFDTASDPINSDDLLKKIKSTNLDLESNSFVAGYTFKEGVKRPEGIFYNWKERYIGYIENYQTQTSYSSKINSIIWIFGKLPIEIKCLNKALEEETTSGEDNKKPEFIKIYIGSNYYDGTFKDITLPLPFEPRPDQQLIIDRIVAEYDVNVFSICRALVWGNPGGGKSFIGKLLAKKFNSAYSFDIKLLDPGTPILNLWQTVMPTREKPLIIQIDEFDIIINKIDKLSKSGDQENPHTWLRTIVGDKQSYNTVLSEYLICLPYVIYLFTMNSNPLEINKLDTSYIRKNRIDLILPLENDAKTK